MRFVPATRIGSAQAASILRRAPRAQITGRLAAGTVAAAGAFAILSSGSPAEAHTATTTPVKPKTQTAAVKPVTVNKYVVTKGDTLSAIAQRSGVSISALVKANGISVRKPIVVGQHLVLPTGRPTAIPAAKLSSTGVMPTDLPADSTRFKLKPTFAAAAKESGVPLDLLQAMTWNESGWQHDAVSHTGAIGIGQLMPDTISYVNTYLVKKPLNPNSDEGNIRISARYLRFLIDQNKGDYRNALAAYYQGPAALRQIGTLAETKIYVANVLALRGRYF